MAQTISGGIRIDGRKSAGAKNAEAFTEPRLVAISMKQHGGIPLIPSVAEGDHVDIGQCIGDNRGAPCCPVHASISGTVKAVENRGGEVFVVIENDMLYTVTPELNPVDGPLTELSAEDIAERVRNAGIISGGVPACEKLSAAVGGVKRLIINCVESEPYLASARRLLLEQPESVIKGAKVLVYALGVRRAVFAAEDGDKELLELLDARTADKRLFSVKTVKAKYPQSGERELVNALYGKEVPAGKRPEEYGFAVFTPEEAAAVYRALATGMPFVHKRITVEGDAIKSPCCLVVPIGATAEEIAEFCGGVKKRFSRLVLGGLMAGTAAESLQCSVGKGTDALLFLSAEKEKKNSGCIRCGRCVRACPMRLMPHLLAAYAEKEKYGKCASLDVFSCTECGCCAYVCPGGVPITEDIRKAKAALDGADMPGEVLNDGKDA